MDDSDQDFVDLYSRPLKRVRKKPVESRPPSDGEKRRGDHRRGPHGDSGSRAAADRRVVCGGGTGHHAGDAESSAVPSAAEPEPEPSCSLARDKVLHRMQQFKRAGPQRMVHKDQGHPDGVPPPPPPPLTQIHAQCDSCLCVSGPRSSALFRFRSPPGAPGQRRGSGPAAAAAAGQGGGRGPDGGPGGPRPLLLSDLPTRSVTHDPRGASAASQPVWTFISSKLSAFFFLPMLFSSGVKRTDALKAIPLCRCLDDSEGNAPAPPPPPPGVPDCPICGQKFKSQKSRSAHLKRCSSDMGVAPAVLLQALQRQTEEAQSAPRGHALPQAGGTKRKGSSKPGLPVRKRPRKKTAPLDEEAMVALALSSSLLDQEQRAKRSQTNAAASHIAMTTALKGTDTVKRRRKRKKGGAPRPPPLLLVQEAEAALARLQGRVSALLLRSRAPSPPTPPRRPSRLPGRSAAAVLWQKSTLLGGASVRLSDFYTPELREFIAPWESAATDAASSSLADGPQPYVQPVSEGTPDPETGASQMSSSPPALSASRALLLDLMELAEDGLTLTQCGHPASGPDHDERAGQISNPRLSGFVLEESEEPAELRASGFLPEPRRGTTARSPERGGHRSVALSRLASDLSSLVNNPQLSDLQLQVDSGEVYSAHSVLLYARCPLLAEMVHESGFGVQEEGGPAVQRVLLNDVPGRAVLALLQFLYTARCSVPAALRTHVLELASRFDLQELQRLCEHHQRDPETLGGEEDHGNQEENHQEENHQEENQQAFAELLRSMWDGEDEDEGPGADGGRHEEGESEDHRADDLASRDREIREENVNEEELEEIYEFAATQRKREEEEDSTEEEEEEEEEKGDEEEDGEKVFTKPAEPQRSPPGLGLDLSYSRLFSDSWGVSAGPSSSPSSSAPAKTPPPQPSSGPSLLRSSASVVDDLSASSLPVLGRSPGPAGDRGGAGDEGTEDPALKCTGPRGVWVPLDNQDPELIVLSDSSEEVEVFPPRSPSPHPSGAVQKPQSYTQLKPPPVPEPDEQKNRPRSLERSPDDPSAAPAQIHLDPWSEQDPADCSPELSWLIPSTPVQPGRRTATGATQTPSSVCRTQLFPKGEASPASPIVTNRVQTSHSPDSAPVCPPGGGAPPLMLDETRRSSVDLDFCSQSPELSRSPPSKREARLCVRPPPCSSTPLHTELRGGPAPLRGDPEESRTSPGKDGAPPESPEETELGSFRLSLASDPSHPPSSSSGGGGLRGSRRQSGSSGRSRRSAGSSGHDDTGSELKGRGLGKDRGEGERGGGEKDTGDEGEQEDAAEGEAGVAQSSFQRRSVDEPPMAFGDSWGLDAVDLEVTPGCFSLRLEDSGASSQQGQRDAARSSSAAGRRVHLPDGHVTSSPPPSAHSAQARGGVSFTPSPPDPSSQTTPEVINSLLGSNIWDSWDEEEEKAPPLPQRANPLAQLRTPAPSRRNQQRPVVPITPLPPYSDMDTPELKNKLNRFGVRPLPKRQMILKLKEIHQYTHQLVSSEEEEEEEEEGPSATVPTNRPTAGSHVPGDRAVSCTQRVKFKEPTAPPREEEEEEEEAGLHSASQGSNSSSTAASEDSERSNPELCLPSDSDSDGGISASQTASRHQDRLRAVRSFILADPRLYGQILRYRPLVLSQFQERLKAAGIRLAATKLLDYLDSQCITVTTAKPGHRRRGQRPKAAGDRGAGRRRPATAPS
ncbi:structure-specific endonuclease subunit SLX4 isoform X2 [Pseudoliparis swirei]|uniref:structure-specific endonuclease subunit SLX4 isoform X2 n=1 Tax=Pseudoliparis swirei TaxID=2059687 RepID=UPI0024BE7E56|nr:structure-specific endonuclease subunit SLX4 isoform X2 [Pseudoliparis swirei]